MNLYPIAERLQEFGLGTMAESIFINMIPVECTQGILLRNPLQGTQIDYELPGYFKTRFQLIVRHATYAGGEELINQALDALTANEIQIGPMYVKFVRPTTKPVVFPLSKGNLLEFATYFEIVFFE